MATRDWLFFMQRRPAEAGGDGGLVEFALDHELRATVIETEDLVIEIETVHDKTQPARQTKAALSVELKMGVEVVVPERTGSAVPITGDIFSVVGEPDADRDATAIIGWANVPGVGRVAHKPRMIGTAEVRSKRSARSGVAVVC